MTNFTLNYTDDNTAAKRGDAMIDRVTGHIVEYRGMEVQGGYAYPERGVRARVVYFDFSERVESIDPARIGLKAVPA